MAKKTNQMDLTAMGRTDIENEIDEYVEHVLAEPRIPTMKNKLIIEASTPGHYPGKLWEKVGIKKTPPWSIEDQSKVILDCIKAGAAGIHAHPRDPKNEYNYECHARGDMDPRLSQEVMDIVYAKADFVPLAHAWHPTNWDPLGEADFISPTKELLEVGKGNKYIQGNVMPTWIYPWSRQGLLSSWFTAKSLREGIAFLEEVHVRPLIALHMEHLEWFKNNVIDHKVFKLAPHLNIQEGKHGQSRSMTDPESYINVITSIQMVRKIVPDATIGMHAGGRNWLPVTAMAIMFGIDLVRIGIEDQFWACPHKDEVLKSPVDSVQKVAAIARALGRDIATPQEAREILGIQVTWK